MIKQVKTCPVLYIDKQEVRNIKIETDQSLYSSKTIPPRVGLVSYIILCNAIQCNAMQCNEMKLNVIQFNAML